MVFDPFVLPFTFGLSMLAVVFTVKAVGWLRRLGSEDRHRITRRLFTVDTMSAVGEVFSESLLHRKIFKANPVLGSMHMSLAFGWFLLIVVGNLQAHWYTAGAITPPHYSVFFNFFVTAKPDFPGAGVLSFLMDALLLLVLSGLAVAMGKRFSSTAVGMKKTTRLKTIDRAALTALWLIFPLRLLAESLTAARFHNGDFLTETVGSALAAFLPVPMLAYPSWWAYSIALGLFLTVLPWTRYMHIPAEVLLIFLRRYGITTNREYTGFSELEVHACSRCGLCLDACPVLVHGNVNTTQAVYFLRSIRERNVNNETLYGCLLCGSCERACPVGLSMTNLRIAQRRISGIDNDADYQCGSLSRSKPADVLYFAGCMTHLTPAIKKSMRAILAAAGVSYRCLDEHEEVCCGRPLIQAGHVDAAAKLIAHNKKMIDSSQARLLVTSCPICYRTFKEDYHLAIEVVHHTEYLLRLVEEGRIQVQYFGETVAYHDPCELGRGCGVVQAPRRLLSEIHHLAPTREQGDRAPCCGGSIGSLTLSNDQRHNITAHALSVLQEHNPDRIVTSCPLCKKTFVKATSLPVVDIAEVMAEALMEEGKGDYEGSLQEKPAALTGYYVARRDGGAFSEVRPGQIGTGPFQQQ